MGSLKATLDKAEEAGRKLAEGESGASGELAGELARAKQQLDELVKLMESGHDRTSASPDTQGRRRPGAAP
jgi:hypothetical protein